MMYSCKCLVVKVNDVNFCKCMKCCKILLVRHLPNNPYENSLLLDMHSPSLEYTLGRAGVEYETTEGVLLTVLCNFSNCF